MTRYIDADNFRKAMIKRFGCIPCLTDYSEASRYDIPIDDALNLEPTADVVPKSEVEKLQAEAENLRNANADLALALLYECEPTKEHLSELEKAVREKVAREIFVEIENAMSDNFHVDCRIGDYIEDYYDVELRDAIAELKKKYTESEKEK